MASDASVGVVILIVEDEFLVRANAVDFLAEAGYEVLEASNADDAIRILEGRNDIRIVFTDIQMPGSMDGIRLAHAIRGRWPPIKLVLTSGRSLPINRQLPHGTIFIPKPYDHRQVVAALQQAAIS